MTKVAGAFPTRVTVAEIGASTDDIVSIDPELVAAVVGDDPDPMFVTIEVLNESKSVNKRFYDRETIIDIAKQVNEKHPDGYAGHLSDSERSHKVPDAETFWLGARVTEVNGKAVMFAKGYVLPEARQRRSVLKRAKAIGRNVAVSIYGTANRTWDKALGAYRLSNYDLESIDWVRPGSEGVRNSGVFQVTSEMRDDSINHEREDMTLEDALKTAKADDLRAHVPAEVIAEMTQADVEAAKAESREVVSEMADLRETLGDKPKEVVAEMQSTIETQKATINQFELKTELQESVKDKNARKMVERMVVAEMRDDAELGAKEAVGKVLASDEGKAIIAEMTVVEPHVTPAISKPGATAHKFIEKKGK